MTMRIHMLAPRVLVSVLALARVVLASSESSSVSNSWHHPPNWIRVSRARIPTPPTASDDEVFPIRQGKEREDSNSWTRHNLDLRSTDYATGIPSWTTTDIADEDSNHESPLSLQLHLATTTTTRSLESSHLSPLGAYHLQPEPELQQQQQQNLQRQRRRHYKKTGTTIAGCISGCGHVILAADTRATQDSYVADKVAQKLHPLGRNAWCAGAGTSADLQALTRLGLYRFALDALQWHSIGNPTSSSSTSSVVSNTNDTTTTVTTSGIAPLYPTMEHQEDDNPILVGIVPLEHICTFFQEKLFQGQGRLGVNLILGCVDSENGTPHLRAFHEHGSMDVDLPFAALGSGGLAAMSMLEHGYRNNLTLPEAIQLVQSAIVAGIQNDLGSGSQVDLCIIRPDGTSHMERCVVPSRVLPDLDIPINNQNDGDNNDTSKNAIPTNEPSMGINGFGNTPFAIHSQRVIMATNQSRDSNAWRLRLGLSPLDNYGQI